MQNWKWTFDQVTRVARPLQRQYSWPGCLVRILFWWPTVGKIRAQQVILSEWKQKKRVDCVATWRKTSQSVTFSQDSLQWWTCLMCTCVSQTLQSKRRHDKPFHASWPLHWATIPPNTFYLYLTHWLCMCTSAPSSKLVVIGKKIPKTKMAARSSS